MLAPGQLAVKVTPMLSPGFVEGDALMLHVIDWQVSVKVDPFWVIPHDAQLGSVKLICAGTWAYPGAAATAMAAAIEARRMRKDRVMASGFL